jgi:hypothetical protein
VSRHIFFKKKKQQKTKKGALVAEPKNKKLGVWPLGVAKPPQAKWGGRPLPMDGSATQLPFFPFFFFFGFLFGFFFFFFFYIYDVALKNPSTMPHGALKPQVPRHV